jgi:hypothetical protein
VLPKYRGTQLGPFGLIVLALACKSLVSAKF